MIFTMAQEPAASKRPVETPPEDDVEKFLSEQKAVEGKRHELIKEMLRQKEAAIKAFDEKLAKLGHHEATPPGEATIKAPRRRQRNSPPKAIPAFIALIPQVGSALRDR